MPSYRAVGVNVRLSACDLKETLTKNLALKKSATASKEADRAQEKLRQQPYLQETNVPFPGDDSGYSVNYVAGAPFLQVAAAIDEPDRDVREEVYGRIRPD